MKRLLSALAVLTVAVSPLPAQVVDTTHVLRVYIVGTQQQAFDRTVRVMADQGIALTAAVMPYFVVGSPVERPSMSIRVSIASNATGISLAVSGVEAQAQAGIIAVDNGTRYREQWGRLKALADALKR